MSRPGTRMYELDLLRFLAAASVVAFHFTYGNHALGLNPVAYPAPLMAVTKYGFLGVQIFFFISGIVILNSAQSGSGRRFAISRIVRLYPAYWACVTLTFLVINMAGTRHIPVSDYVVNMTMLEGFVLHPLVDAVYWTLQVELVFYGIIWLTLVAGQMKRITLVLWAWLGVAAALSAAQLAGVVVPNRFVVAIGYAPYFVTGAAAALITRGNRSRPVVAMLVAAGGLSLVRAIFDARNANDHYHAINTSVAVAIVAVSMVVVLAVAFGRLSRIGRPWMVSLGLLTYPLYLIHDEVSNVLFNHWKSVNRWLLLPLVLAVVLAIATAVHLAVEEPVAPRLRAVLTRGFGRDRPAGVPIAAASRPE
ncbi:MAG TPA: acyltransferase [Acidimicrobiales bacterium]|nr:acyltransferase [Acidimicrobiales bacterium]